LAKILLTVWTDTGEQPVILSEYVYDSLEAALAASPGVVEAYPGLDVLLTGEEGGRSWDAAEIALDGERVVETLDAAAWREEYDEMVAEISAERRQELAMEAGMLHGINAYNDWRTA
jgi:hypothetical protein